MSDFFYLKRMQLFVTAVNIKIGFIKKSRLRMGFFY